MSEERRMILQMLADGKITADEAETLLQAIEESERTARETVVVSAQQTEPTAGGLQSLGRLIDQSVRVALQSVDEALRSLEERLEHDQARKEELKHRIEERIRQSTERALERVLQAEERAARALERAAARLKKKEARLKERAARKHFVKTGVHIDKERVARTDRLTLAAQPGDRFVLQNRVGDVEIEFYDGDEIDVEARKTVWGSDEADANQRADATAVRLVRNGSDVRVEVERPTISAAGVIHLKDTRIDYRIRLPRLTHLEVSTMVGDIRVRGGDEIATWFLASKVGDIDLAVPPAAGFTYALRTRMGKVDVDLRNGAAPAAEGEGQAAGGEMERTGVYGEGGGRIDAATATGEIRLHH